MADEAGPRFTIAGNFPSDEDNGFAGIASDVLAGGMNRKRWITVVIWEAASTKIDHKNGNVRSQTMRVVSVEPLINQGDAEQALAMHDRAHGDRTGETTLDAHSVAPGGDE
jgi:hypothetical protein